MSDQDTTAAASEDRTIPVGRVLSLIDEMLGTIRNERIRSPLEALRGKVLAEVEQQQSTADEPVRNVTLAELAAVAHEFLEPRVGLPELAGVELRTLVLGPDSAEIELHLAGSGSYRHVALWATEFASTVRVLDRETFVSCWAETLVGGHSVRVWTHITREQAAEILEPAGQVLGEHVAYVDPILMAAKAPSTEAGA